MVTLLLLGCSVTKFLDGVVMHLANGIDLTPRHEDRDPRSDEGYEHASPDRPDGGNQSTRNGNNRCRDENDEHTLALASVLFNPFEIMHAAHAINHIA